MSLKEESLKLHKDSRGKIEIRSKVPLRNGKDIALAYTPGVAEVSREIAADKSKVYDYTSKWNAVAVVSDGSRVLGLGNVGPEAALPVMEGKAILFKALGGVDAFPICLATQDKEEIIETVKRIAPAFGGIVLEDIEKPKCFEIEARLKQELDIPIFHDDQHGTAVVVLAALLNALKVVGKQMDKVRVIINGAGAAGIAVGKMLLKAGVRQITVCDSAGAIYEGRKENMEAYKEEIAKLTNKERLKGDLDDVIRGADVFIGLSVAGALKTGMIKTMAEKPVIFALANPTPEIEPSLAEKGGAEIIATGRSDYPNQVNNVLAFPGILRGALDARAREINEDMKVAAAEAIAGLIEKPDKKRIIPEATDKRVAEAVAKAVVKAAVESGVARKNF